VVLGSADLFFLSQMYPVVLPKVTGHDTSAQPENGSMNKAGLLLVDVR
jgi:hypothetical protein